MEHALLSFFQRTKDLVTDRRPLRLRLSHPTQMLEDVLLPQRVEGGEAVCGGLEYRILCVSLDAFIPLKELIALPVAVDIVTDRGELRSICGIVTEARAGDSDGGLASYLLVLRDALSILEKRSNTRVFRNRNEVEIVKVILDEWLHTNAIIGASFKLEMDALFARNTYPKREFTMQYNESDAAFIRRLLKRRGIAWYFRADGDKFPAHTMVLFDHPASLRESKAGIVRYHRDAATEERDSITSWCAVRTLQPARVTRFSWNYKNPRVSGLMFATDNGRADQGESGNHLAAKLDDYQVLSPHAGDNHDELCELGHLAMQRHEYESKCFYAEGSVRDLCAGECFALEGHPEIDPHRKNEREFVVTSMSLAASNNLPNDLTARVERLFAANRWSDSADTGTRFKLRFTCVRRDIAIVPAFNPQKDLPDIPMQSATVVGPPGEEVYCDELGRVKVRFASSRPADHAHAEGAGANDNGTDSAWIRVASSWAGAGLAGIYQCGTFTLPRIGSEVLVAFLGGDPDKPVIVGQLYNAYGTPPSLGGNGLPSNRYLSGMQSCEIRDARTNRLLFDDTQGEISAQLASEHAEAQLNLGFITTPRNYGEGQARGEGAELRTKEHMALRAGKGILLSGWRAGDERILARGEMLGILDECADLGKAIGALAEKCRALRIERDAIDELMQALKNWDARPQASESAPIGLTAPSGITLATPKVIANYAGQDIESVAQGQLSLTAGQQLCINAGAGASLFAQSGGLRAIAQQGAVLVQSQNDATEVNAAKELMLTATEGKVVAMAKEIVLIAEDGSFIKVGGGITLGTNGTITHHGASFPFKGAKTMSAELPKFEQSRTELRFQGRYYANRGDASVPASGMQVEIHSSDGTQRREQADSDGRTGVLEADAMHQATARVQHDPAGEE